MCQQLHTSTATHFLIPRKSPRAPNICTHTHIRTCVRACMHARTSLHEPPVLCGCSVSENSTLPGFGLFVTETPHSNECTFFSTAQASTHPQSPRIGRTRVSSLGELTGGAGLQTRVDTLDSYTVGYRKELQCQVGGTCIFNSELYCVYVLRKHRTCSCNE